MNCPNCNADHAVFLPQVNRFYCTSCKEEFEAVKKSKTLRVFVSYGHDEYLPFARGVARELENKGHKVWFDEDRLQPGYDWEKYIEEGLEWISEDSCNGRIVLIMTPYSVRRPDGYCLNELAKALDHRIKIIPVMLVWTTPPLSIYRLQWLDLQGSVNKTSLTETFQTDFSKICQALENPDYLDTGGNIYRLFSELNPLNFEADLVLNQVWFVGRQWVFQEIKRWLNDKKASRLFWLTGVPGIGKTAIATQLIQKFPAIAAFHLCRRGHSEKASPRRAICTIAYQLSTQLPGYRERLLQMNIKEPIENYNDVALFERLIVQPLCQLAEKPAGIVVILIDGLDEATQNGFNSIAQFIAAEFDKLPEWIRIIVTSRPDPEVTVPLQSFDPWVLHSESAENQQDITEYIDQRLEIYQQQNRYDEVKTVIVKNADGVFLYVKHVCDEIIAGRLSFDKPDRFPQGLGGVYEQYFSNKFQDSEVYARDVRPALEVLMSAYEPMTEPELQKYLQWDNYELERFFSYFGSFIVKNTNERIVPFHASLFDWLGIKAKAGIWYWIDKERGHRIISQSVGQTTKYTLYQLRYLTKHLVKSGDRKRFLLTFCDPDYMRQRQSVFPLYDFFKLFFEDLALWYETGEPMFDVYNSPVFQQIILENCIYFFDHDFYKDLNKLGFGEYVRTIEGYEHSVELKTILISYYYIIYDIRSVIRQNLEIGTDAELAGFSGAELLNYRLVYEIKGSSYRIAGNFEKAKTYIAAALKCAHLLGNIDFMLVLNSVYARIEMHQEKYIPAIQRLKASIAQGDEIAGKLTLENDLTRIQHIRTGSTLILIEQYLNLNETDKALPLLEQMSELYRKPQDYDRYWSRYLYMSTRYAIQVADDEMYEKYYLLLKPFDMNLPGGRLFYHHAVYLWVKGIARGEWYRVDEASSIIDRFNKLAYERYDLELLSEGIALRQLIAETRNEDYPIEFSELEPFRNWIRFKQKLFRQILALHITLEKKASN